MAQTVLLRVLDAKAVMSVFFFESVHRGGLLLGDGIMARSNYGMPHNLFSVRNPFESLAEA